MNESQPSKKPEEAEQAMKKGSRSGRSHRSARSSASATASYAEKETIMMRESDQPEEHQLKTLAEITCRRAEVEAELYVLKLQKEAVAASTEAEVYEVATHREDGLDVDL